MKRYKLAFLISHPIQYFSPLFKKISEESDLDLTVYYCSDETLKFFKDIGFGKKIKWDIPLLEGYKYKFLKNRSPKPSIFSGFFGLINFDIIKELNKNKYDAIIIHGWNYFTHILTIIFSKILKTKIMIRGDNSYSSEIKKPLFKRMLKRILFKYFIFKLIDIFLYIGEENKKFYRYYGVPENKLFFVPYSVDNERFGKVYEDLKDKRKELRRKMNLPEDFIIILFVGKLIHKKRPFDLLKAFEKIDNEKIMLLFVGEGYLRESLENYVKNNNLKNVIFAGFKNQSEIPYYYLISDLFVLPSGMGETWGLVVNEAMNFELPIIVSDLVGCSKDLVKHGENGFIFKPGDVDALSRYLDILIKDADLRKNMGKKSLEMIKKYSYGESIKGIKRALKYF